MKNKLVVILILLVSLLLTSAAVSYAQPAAPVVERAGQSGRHCIAEAQVGTDDTAADATLPAEEAPAPAATCFGTFAEALGAVTGAPAGIDPNIKPADVTDAMLSSLAQQAQAFAPAPMATSVLSIEYSGSGYSGASLTFYVSNSVGCYYDNYYFSSTAPSGWNDRVSSSRGYSGCGAIYHFEHSNYGGAVLRCNACSSYGAMDNRTSSWRFYRTSPHY